MLRTSFKSIDFKTSIDDPAVFGTSNVRDSCTPFRFITILIFNGALLLPQVFATPEHKLQALSRSTK